jgi:hypothetical protein
MYIHAMFFFPAPAVAGFCQEVCLTATAAWSRESHKACSCRLTYEFSAVVDTLDCEDRRLRGRAETRCSWSSSSLVRRIEILVAGRVWRACAPSTPFV